MRLDYIKSTVYPDGALGSFTYFLLGGTYFTVIKSFTSCSYNKSSISYSVQRNHAPCYISFCLRQTVDVSDF